MEGLLLLVVSLVIAILFAIGVHFIVAPYVKFLYFTYEPIMFHYKYKLACRIKKVKKKSLESYLKVRYFFLVYVMRK